MKKLTGKALARRILSGKATREQILRGITEKIKANRQRIATTPRG